MKNMYNTRDDHFTSTRQGHVLIYQSDIDILKLKKINIPVLNNVNKKSEKNQSSTYTKTKSFSVIL